MSSNVTLHGKDYQTGNILPIAVNSTGELIIDSGGAIDLANLGDVSLAGLANNNLLQYDGTVNYWVNRDSLGGNIGFESLHVSGSASLTNLWVSGLSNLANVSVGNLSISGLSNLANVGVSGNLDVLGYSNLANLSVGNLVVLELSNLANVGVSGNLDVLGYSNLANLSVGNLVVLELSNLANVGVSGNLDVLGTSNLANVSVGNLVVLELSNLANVGISGNLDVLGQSNLANLSVGKLVVLELSNLANVGISGNLDVLGTSNLANLSVGNLVVLELSNLANVGISGNLDVLGTSNLANVSAGNLVVTELSNLANVGVSGNLDVLGTSNLANVSVGNLVVLELSNLANVGISGNLDVLGQSNLANLSVGNLVVSELSNLANVGISGNLDVLGYSNLANLSVGNLVVLELSNLANVGISGNLDVLGYSNLANLSVGNLVVLELSNLANVGVLGNLDVLGTSNLANLSVGNLVVLELSNLANVGISGNLDVLGYSNLANLSVGNLVVLDAGKLEFRDGNTFIQSTTTGNLDIFALDGNINITANHDIILTSNSPSTIKLIGPGGNLITSFGQGTGSNINLTVGGANNIVFADGDAFGLKQLFSSNIVLDNQVIGGVDSYVITGQPNPKVSYSNNDIPMSAIYTFTSNVSNADNFAFKKANGTYWTTTPPYSPNSNTIVAISGVQQQINLGALGRSISFNKGTKSNIWISNSGQLILDDSSTATSNIILVFSGVTLGTYPSSNVYYGLATTTNTDDALVITYKDVGINPGTGSAGNLYAQVVLYCDNSPLSGTYELNYGSLNTPFGTYYNYYVGCQGNLSVLATQLTASMVETNFGRYPYYNTVFKKANNEMSICMDIDQNMNYFNMSNVKGIYGTGFRSNGSSLQYSVGANGGKWSNFVGGVDSQIQFNDGGVASGDSGLTFTKSSKLLTVSGNIVATYNISAGANIYGQSGLIVGSQYTSNPPTMNSVGLYNIGSVNAAANSNLDIRSTTGNVNITANGDIILTSNSPSTIKLVGPGNSPMVSISQDAGGNTFMSFGSTTGESGYGIKADATGNVLIKSQGASGWAGVSNTQISIAGRTVELGGSNTIGFDNLTGNIAATQISPTSITNAQLVNSNVIVAGKTVSLGSSATIGFSDLATGNIATTQISPATITNTQLVNSNIVIGGQTINLGGSGSLEFSNITGNLNTGTQIVNGNIANDKLANSNIVIGGQTINLGGSGNIRLSNLSDVSISGTPSNGSILKYNTGTAIWEPFAPQFLSILFPTAAVARIGSVISAANISIANVNMTYTQLANNTVVTSNPNNCWEFQNLSNSFYKFTASFTYQNDGGAADTGFYLRFYEANAYVVQTADSTYTTGSSAGNTSFSIIRDYRASIPSNVGVVFLNEPANVLNYYYKGCTVLAERLIF